MYKNSKMFPSRSVADTLGSGLLRVGTVARPLPSEEGTPSERRGNTSEGFKDFCLKAKARIWP